MIPVVASRKAEIEEICRRFGVRRLELFGSAASGEFQPERSDLDFLVDLGEAPPAAYAEAYFGLLEALQQLFGRSIDLVTEPSVRNPYFRQSIDRTRKLVYAA
jgi:predicted nucleotidyltransferase